MRTFGLVLPFHGKQKVKRGVRGKGVPNGWIISRIQCRMVQLWNLNTSKKMVVLLCGICTVDAFSRIFTASILTGFRNFPPSSKRFLAVGTSNLRGDGGNYVDTVQCTGSGTLPTQPAAWPEDRRCGRRRGRFQVSSLFCFDFRGLLQWQRLIGDLWYRSGELWWQLEILEVRIIFREGWLNSPHFCWFPALGNIVLLSNGLIICNVCLSWTPGATV